MSYIFVAGLLRRDRRAIAASMIVAFMYGSLTLGLLPTPPEISWETHLAAAIFGALLALLLRHYDVLPAKRYTWEDDDAWPPSDAEVEDIEPHPIEPTAPPPAQRHLH